MSQEASGFAGPGHGEFCWTEIATNDSAKAKEFYTNVFGWKFQDSNAVTDGFAYHEFSIGDGEYPAGGLYQISPEMCGPDQPPPPPHFLAYIAVDDVNENARRAIDLGGRVIKEPSDIPNTGRFAIIADPSGAMFSIFKMAEGGHNG